MIGARVPRRLGQSVRHDAGHRRQRGQGLVEFALITPGLMLILVSMLEFGLLFNHDLTLQYATREGARTGAALACGALPSAPTICDSPSVLTSGPKEVDPYIVAAVQRVLESSGSPIDMTQISTIKIYKADANGDQIGSLVDTWRYQAGGGPTLAGEQLDFVRQGTTGWGDSTRDNGADPDSLGVSISYTYQWVTPLGNIMRLLGGSAGGQTAISDRTVMALNPSQ